MARHARVKSSRQKADLWSFVVALVVLLVVVAVGILTGQDKEEPEVKEVPSFSIPEPKGHSWGEL